MTRSMVEICSDIVGLVNPDMTPERKKLVDELDAYYKEVHPNGIPVICGICRKELDILEECDCNA